MVLVSIVPLKKWNPSYGAISLDVYYKMAAHYSIISSQKKRVKSVAMLCCTETSMLMGFDDEVQHMLKMPIKSNY